VTRIDIPGDASFSVDGQISDLFIRLGSKPHSAAFGVTVDAPRTVTIDLTNAGLPFGVIPDEPMAPIPSPARCVRTSIQNDGSIPKSGVMEEGTKAVISSQSVEAIEMLNVPSFFLTESNSDTSIGGHQESVGFTTVVSLTGWTTVGLVDDRIVTVTRAASEVTFNGNEQRSRRWSFLTDVPGTIVLGGISTTVALLIGALIWVLLARRPQSS
jgi:hypothetical protein